MLRPRTTHERAYESSTLNIYELPPLPRAVARPRVHRVGAGRTLYGNGLRVTRPYTTVIGSRCVVAADHCRVLGSHNIVVGSHCLVVGQNNDVKGRFNRIEEENGDEDDDEEDEIDTAAASMLRVFGSESAVARMRAAVQRGNT